MSGLEPLILAGAAGGVGQAALIGGTLLSTVGALQAASAQQDMANYQAQLADNRAKEEKAVGIKRSQEERRRMRLATSRSRAVGAASGGGVDWENIADLEAEGELRAQTAIWEGESKATDLRNQGREARARGREAKRAGTINAAATVLGGVDNLMYKYG